MKIHSLALAVALVGISIFSSPCFAQNPYVEPGTLPQSWSEQIDLRSIGPANMSGRITSIAVYEKDPTIWWAASASGGLIKTTNNGVTFEHQFDDQATVSIGDVQVSKTDPNLVWVGTGESNPRNSVSWGDGVYKSTDGGKTWKNMGLKETFQTGRIAIHPKNHDIVYVGSLGRLWGPNEQRGLFKTTDGGKTWKKILYVDDKTGVVDVQMNPDNPDELLVATYERLRDGFDGNDPAKKYGAGSAIYKTTDGGKTFRRLSQGLPTCKLGRIGLNYYLKDPNYVCAIVESEKIAKQPTNAPFAGLQGRDADVGAQITRVTAKGPSESAGLKVDDIVVSIDGDIVYSYNDLLSGIRKRAAGETVKLVVSRQRKPIDITLKLGKQPRQQARGRNRRRRGRNPFTGTLGGQAANLQGQQGDNEEEYGGIYLSSDGGESWKRINTLNPRPMYYSQIRFDPTDRMNMYVLGTSLYRSTDGGETFTGDGGRGTHPDNHALWIDPRDSRHMILGNDGGIYVTYNRMDNWDHHNHIAIGQFYHAGVGSRTNYRVYGGLQDNGSWGGPSRVSNDQGSVNTDWFRVGGGDGFITIPDPDDPDQIYAESQNGAMSRINLRTGDRGFIRPRPPRGTRYRFNWKTPFILSPHNSKIHYSAGNYVFRSLNKGTGIKAISPEITNTNRGAGSAITESPVQAGVLYVGTTDGALWMTKDGGENWEPLYHQPVASNNSDDGNKQQSSSISGTWKGKITGGPTGENGIEITIELEAKSDKQISGKVTTPRGAYEITEGGFKPDSKKLYFYCDADAVFLDFETIVDGTKMNGDVMFGNEATAKFEAENTTPPSPKPEADKPESQSPPTQNRRPGYLGISPDRELAITQVVGGAPADAAGVELGDVIRSIAGTKVDSMANLRTVLATKKAGDTIELIVERSGEEKTLSVTLGEAPQQRANPRRRGRRRRPANPPATTTSADDAQKATAEDQPAKNQSSPKADDPISGTWTGSIDSPQGATDLTLKIKRKTDQEVTGTYATARSDGDITEGRYNPKTKRLSLLADTGQFTLEFSGEVDNGSLSGQVDFNGGTFSMDFSAKRSSATAAVNTNDAKKSDAKNTDAKSLADLAPGPRWVSSLHASRFKAQRCYLSLDGHRSNDLAPHVFVTEDFGKTWRSIKSNLPDTAGSVRVVREDRKNENVLYLGCEFGAWVSVNRGRSWTKLANLPTVAVHEFAQHPTLDDVVVATHGRSLWIADVSVIRQTTPDSVSSETKLFQPRDVINWSTTARRGSSGTRKFVGTNPTTGAKIFWSLGSNARSVELSISNLKGETIQRFEDLSTTKGLHSAQWNLRVAATGRNRRFGPRVSPGDYMVNLRVNGELMQSSLRVVGDPDRPADAVAEDAELQWWLEMQDESND